MLSAISSSHYEKCCILFFMIFKFHMYYFFTFFSITPGFRGQISLSVRANSSTGENKVTGKKIIFFDLIKLYYILFYFISFLFLINLIIILFVVQISILFIYPSYIDDINVSISKSTSTLIQIRVIHCVLFALVSNEDYYTHVVVRTDITN